MAETSGIWRSRGIIPATRGVMQATPEEVTMTRYPNGQLLFE
jgi:hypothetical protein